MDDYFRKEKHTSYGKEKTSVKVKAVKAGKAKISCKIGKKKTVLQGDSVWPDTTMCSTDTKPNRDSKCCTDTKSGRNSKCDTDGDSGTNQYTNADTDSDSKL